MEQLRKLRRLLPRWMKLKFHLRMLWVGFFTRNFIHLITAQTFTLKICWDRSFNVWSPSVLLLSRPFRMHCLLIWWITSCFTLWTVLRCLLIWTFHGLLLVTLREGLSWTSPVRYAIWLGSCYFVICNEFLGLFLLKPEWLE